MTSDRAQRAAALVYEEVVGNRPEAALGLWQNADYAASEGAEFQRISDRIRSMTADDRALIGAITRRVAADTLLDTLHIIAGSRDIGVSGEWALTLDGEDVGGALLDEALKRTAD